MHGGHGAGCACPACAGASGDKVVDEKHELMEAVKCAKESLLKEKIKAKLDAKIGKKMDKLADIAVEMLLGKWEMMKEKEERREALLAKIASVMESK